MNQQGMQKRGAMPPMHRPGGPRPGGPMGARVNREKPKNLRRTLGRLLKYIGKSKLLVIGLVVIMAIVTLSDLAGPALQGAAINTIRVDESGGLSVDFAAMKGYLSAMGRAVSHQRLARTCAGNPCGKALAKYRLYDAKRSFQKDFPFADQIYRYPPSR